MKLSTVCILFLLPLLPPHLPSSLPPLSLLLTSPFSPPHLPSPSSLPLPLLQLYLVGYVFSLVTLCKLMVSKETTMNTRKIRFGVTITLA